MSWLKQLSISLCFLLSIGQIEAANLKGFERELTDSMITTKITAKITKNKNLNPLKIQVSTENGMVNIKGNVKDAEAFEQALQLVRSTRGVKGINAKNLHVKVVNTLFTDIYITTKVEGAVLKAKLFDDESIPLVGINASTTNGVVTLTGDVRDDNSVSAILKRVNAVNGVRKIISNLQIKQAV